jgi:hypothetical protein
MADKEIPDLTSGGAVVAGDVGHVYRNPNSRKATFGHAAGLSMADITTFLSYGLVASVASNALTIALKGADGNDPAAANPVSFVFRNATPATGTPVVRTATAAMSLVISSGSTMGFTSAQAGRLWIVVFDDAGTLRLGAINCRSGTNIFPLGAVGIASSTAEGGAGAADSAHVFYTGTAVTSKAFVILGYLDWASGLTTAGTYAIVPTTIKLFAQGDKLPGDVIQRQSSQISASATGTTVMPADNTIPQSTEGDQYASQAITPTASPNVLAVEFYGLLSSSNTAASFGVALFQDSAANALAASGSVFTAAFDGRSIPLTHELLAGTTSATTFKIRAGSSGAGTTSFIASNGSRQYGAIPAARLGVSEIMA